jgi:hypothetical protein
MAQKLNFLFMAVFFAVTQTVTAQTEALRTFSDPSRLWGNGIERVIEEAYRQCIRTKIIDGRVMNVRLPFAMNNDRDALIPSRLDVLEDGKGSPDLLWPSIEEILASHEFAEYIRALSSGREKVIIFDMAQRKWSTSTDLFLIARIKAGSYKGIPHRPYVLTSGRGALESDVYNYLYCIGFVGMDCSGFVWHVLDYIGKQGGIDLSRTMAPAMGLPRDADLSRYVGTSFLNSRNPQIIAVNDEIRNLRPGDIMLFRDIEGVIVHSAVIQSIDRANGVLRYVQCNNVAPLDERGVHDSYIYFDPSNPAASLKDPSLHWSQKRFAPYSGEEIPWADDGERYRYVLNGGGRVVRLQALIPAIEKINSSK